MPVRITLEAADQLDRLPLAAVRRVRAVIDRLESWPDVSGIKWLTGDLKGCARIRTGDYRVLFRVVGDNVIIERIADPRDAYDTD